MMKAVLKYILPFVLLVVSCAKEPEPGVVEPAPLQKTVHYRATVEADAGTRATVDDNLKYVFEAGDQIYLESEGGEMYGFLSLSQASDAGKTLAFFEGDLTCAEGFSPKADTPVSLMLVGPEDKIHVFDENGKLSGIDYGGKKATSLKEAVRSLSLFSASGKFGDLHFTLSQQSSFLVFSFQFDEDQVEPGTRYRATLYNAYDNAEARAELYSCSFETREEEDGGIEASWVAGFAGNTALSGAGLVLRKDGEEEDLVLRMNDNTLAASSYYTFQRATFMQDYLTVEATQPSTEVTFNKATTNGIQYSLDGYDWKNYERKITLTSAGDKVYFRGKGTTYQHTGNSSGLLSVNKASYVYGDLMFLMCNEKYKAKKVIEADFAFQRAFYNASWLLLSEDPGKTLKLSATTLSTGCYFEMFQGCTGITKLDNLVLGDAPLTERCYDSMFYGCKGLLTVPDGFLPKTGLALACYRRMFYDCQNLETVPADLLPATVLAPCCYMNMFFNCYKLKAGPDLLAREPAAGCYFSIFRHCKAIGYVKCLLEVSQEQMNSRTNPDTKVYDDSAAPSPDKLGQWTVVSAWSVFNKWLDDVPNTGSCEFVRNPNTTYPRGNSLVVAIPTNWIVTPPQ